jgi:hypothetical protein
LAIFGFLRNACMYSICDSMYEEEDTCTSHVPHQWSMSPGHLSRQRGHLYDRPLKPTQLRWGTVCRLWQQSPGRRPGTPVSGVPFLGQYSFCDSPFKLRKCPTHSSGSAPPHRAAFSETSVSPGQPRGGLAAEPCAAVALNAGRCHCRCPEATLDAPEELLGTRVLVFDFRQSRPCPSAATTPHRLHRGILREVSCSLWAAIAILLPDQARVISRV